MGNKDKDDNKDIKKAVSILKKGGLVIIPTETVYGMIADPFNKKAIKKIYDIKLRDEKKPLQILISSIGDVKRFASKAPKKAIEMAKEIWPGPLTLVLKKKKSVPDTVTAGFKTIGLRMPDHEIALAIIREFGYPIAATSANISGKPPAITAGQAKKYFPKGVDLFIDGGKCKIGKASVVVDASGRRLNVIRK